jgi:rhamnosyl/mannosyltransferase
VVLPSHLRSEAYGMALVEAALWAKPMISCEIGTGTSYVNLDGITGFVVPPRDPLALSRAMQALIDNETLALRFGHAARARYEEMFSGEAMGRNHFALYKEALSAGKRCGAAETMPA